MWPYLQASENSFPKDFGTATFEATPRGTFNNECTKCMPSASYLGEKGLLLSQGLQFCDSNY